MTQATLKPHKCLRCGGSAPFEEGVSKCISCGHEQVDRRQRHEFLEDHREEILRDVVSVGPGPTKKKWGLQDSTFENLKRRWGLRLIWWAPGMQPFSRDGLPKLPAWRKDWPPEFKMKWLETYQAILGVATPAGKGFLLGPGKGDEI